MNQPAPGSTFDTDWLSLRESADAAARDATLTEHARRYLIQRQQPQRSLSLIDLGSGGGSNLRFLVSRLPGPQHWRLIDHDAALLDNATFTERPLRDSNGDPVVIQADCRDLAGLEADWLSGCDLVCASALFDLVSLEWLERLVAACTTQQTAALFTLSVDGEWAFVDRDGQFQNHPEDRWIRHQLITHQRRDKGFGTALGSQAPPALEQAFSRRGYHVENAPSPWRLAPGLPDTQALGRALIKGWATAVHEQSPGEKQRMERWLSRRLAQLDEGVLGLEVGHVDLLAYPAESASKGSEQ
ncbi:class I SAM-dependent methyltransferase [Halomonas sp. GXIMD04776]|uniref:class I SAM-dependent methyltransferase n=1 Tax=Halomonas sp. GXIMD04776 TaxID=3415605 RepID=UPI003CA6E9BD